MARSPAIGRLGVLAVTSAAGVVVVACELLRPTSGYDNGGPPLADAADTSAFGDGANAPEAPACPEGTKRCDDDCVSLDIDFGCASPSSCKPCPGPSYGSVICSPTGACGVSCDSTHADCNQDPRDGCEVDIASGDPANCGGCGIGCGAEQLCYRSGCIARDGGCPGPTVDCDGGCADPSTSPNHCGRCDIVCEHEPNATATCTAKACAGGCAPGYSDCNGDAGDGCESYLATDPSACGACGTTCRTVGHWKGVCRDGGCGRVCTCTAPQVCNSAGACVTCLTSGANGCGSTPCCAGSQCNFAGKCD